MLPVQYAMNVIALTTEILVRPAVFDEMSAQAEKVGMTKLLRHEIECLADWDCSQVGPPICSLPEPSILVRWRQECNHHQLKTYQLCPLCQLLTELLPGD